VPGPLRVVSLAASRGRRALLLVAGITLALLAPAAPAAPARGDLTTRGGAVGLAQAVTGMSATPSGRGYWLVASDGRVSSSGDAPFLGSVRPARLRRPIVGIAATPSGNGYWLVAADGSVFRFGDAQVFGSAKRAQVQHPIVGMAGTPSGRGYWLVASDGVILPFGDAAFAGSPAGTAVDAPVVGVAPTSSGRGYWVALADGRVLPFGDARALEPRSAPARPTVGIAALADGSGYWTVARSGAVQAYGAASQVTAPVKQTPVVGIAAAGRGNGYWLATSDGAVVIPGSVGSATDLAVVAPGESYAFLAKDPSGRPMRFDPCRPVRFAINPAGAPPGGVDEVREAIRRAGQATGITFEDAGETTETHSRIGAAARASFQPDRYGTGRWAPILVSWSSEADEPVLQGGVLGYGGATSFWLGGTDPAYVTGEIVLDRDVGPLRPGFGPGLTRGNLVAHELGHVIGLDHVQDRRQVMYPAISASSPDSYGIGDRAGLAALGAEAGCLTVATPR
jgi:hypothetical protein